MGTSENKQSCTHPLLGIYGGTFDPVHIGHLRTAIEVLENLELSELRFVPSASPPHKTGGVSPIGYRLEMLNLAIADGCIREFSVDGREALRQGPSYTVDTLMDLKMTDPDSHLALIMGMDAWLSLHAWYRWEELFELAHIVVLNRPMAATEKIPEVLQKKMDACRTDQVAQLHSVQNGLLYFTEVTQLAISSSMIRKCLARGQSIRYLVPEVIRPHLEKDFTSHNI